MRISRYVPAGLLLALLAPLGAAHASSISISYYTIAESDRDANTMCCATINNEVENSLGANGLPVLNPLANGGKLLPKDILADDEITYWSPALNNGGPGGTSDVTYTGSAVVPLPFDQSSNFFPPNGTGLSDSNGFQAAVLSGWLDAPITEQVSFNIGADDMAFAYLNGQLVCDLGGVHPITNGTCVSPFDVSAGTSFLQVFFVDINNVQSGLTFGVQTAGVTITNVPEPGSLALFGAGLLGVLVLFMRRRRLADAASSRKQ
ncbi:MAG: PEP-CTERM sorting domain-containing protein [Steroidobacteraceae bacterium]